MKGGLNHRSLSHALAGGLFWVASFAYACSLFFTLRKPLRNLDPEPPVAIGRVVIDSVSKTSEYAMAALFFVAVPILTILLRRGLEWWHDRLASDLPSGGQKLLSAFLFSLPWIAAPALFLTTQKEIWGVLFPAVLPAAGPGLLRLYRTRRWIRQIFRPGMAPFHALLLAEAAAWILFRYLATGKWIAHISTLFLEVLFVAFFAALFEGLAILLARLKSTLRGTAADTCFARITIGASPLLALPLAALFAEGSAVAAAAIWLVSAANITVHLLMEDSALPNGRRVRTLVGWVAVPLLLLVGGWASTVQLSEWVDLFHRGESLGPASDYLRGDLPYRDVFVLHGLLEDGMLDAWLMTIFGRSAEVAVVRAAVLAAATIPALWILGLVIFESFPLALLVVMLGYATFIENPRALPEILAAAALVAAFRRRNGWMAALAGALGGFALFLSFDIGLYTLGGSAIALAVLTIWRVRTGERGRLWLLPVAWAGGVAAGIAPFCIGLAAAGVFGEFLRVSFIDVPRFIDPVWSLPFPDYGAQFKNEFSLRKLLGFLLGEGVRFILNPIVIAVAIGVLIHRFYRRTIGNLELALLAITALALVTQRSALGRADFTHQYFSAFLIAPILVVLGTMLFRSASQHWHEGRGSERVLLVTLSLVLVSMLGATLWIPDLVELRLRWLTSYRARLGGAELEAHVAETRERIAAVSREVRLLSGEDESIFDFSNQPALYFYADRRNPTRFYQVPILSPPRFQAETIRALERSRPAVVLRGSPTGFDRFDGIRNEVRAQAVAAWIDANYEFRRTIRGLELWTPRERPVRAPISTWLEAIHLPDRELIDATTERVVFPAVGTVRGANDAEWVSDLLVHNQSDAAVELRLRFSGSGGSADRSLVVPPGRLQRFHSFSATLFGFDQSVGSLWIEYPIGNRPALFVETRDSSLPGSGTRTSPLHAAQAVEESGERDELLVIGADGTWPRRVNIGVVNFGTRPAIVRIHATTESGEVIGLPVQHQIAEEDSWILVDAASHLGVPIEGGTVIHATAIRGKIAAWASVVDAGRGIHQVLEAFPATNDPNRRP
jgi:hypothetical protein